MYADMKMKRFQGSALKYFKHLYIVNNLNTFSTKKKTTFMHNKECNAEFGFRDGP